MNSPARLRHRPRRVVTPRKSLRGVQFASLKTYIETSGDTQERIAAALGMSQAYISRIVNGDAVPRPEAAVRLAEYANLPLDSFQRVYLDKKGRGKNGKGGV